MSEYKTGDMVRIKNTDYEDCGLAVGTVHSVMGTSVGVLLGDDAGCGLYFHNWEVEPAEVEPAIAPQTPAQTPEFKAYVNILEFNAGADAVRYARQVSGYNP